VKSKVRGQILVEFALVSPLMIGLLLGAMSFGYSFYTYVNLVKAVRDAGRYASMRTYKSGDASFAAAVQNVVVYGTPSPSAGQTPVVHGLTAGAVTVTPPTGFMTTVKVSISSFSLPMVLGSVTLQNKPNVTFRYTGRYIP